MYTLMNHERMSCIEKIASYGINCRNYAEPTRQHTNTCDCFGDCFVDIVCIGNYFIRSYCTEKKVRL